MLSKENIIKELGKGINLYPFHEKNIKENSINLTIGRNAWTLGGGQVLYDKEEKKFTLMTSKNQDKYERIVIKNGDSCVIKKSKISYLLLFPHQTTVVETSEVIGIENYIGGTFHSKVGVVANGIGHIGTMLGPCFCGHLMISLHNITDNLVVMKVGDTFISLAFYYLDTPIKSNKNSNISGHVDKLSELGININSTTREFLTTEWKMNVDGIRKKMKQDKGYINFKKNQRFSFNEIKSYLNLNNFLIVTAALAFFIFFGFLAFNLDKHYNTDCWVERFWGILSSVILVPAFLKLWTKIQKS